MRRFRFRRRGLQSRRGKALAKRGHKKRKRIARYSIARGGVRM